MTCVNSFYIFMYVIRMTYLTIYLIITFSYNIFLLTIHVNLINYILVCIFVRLLFYCIHIIIITSTIILILITTRTGREVAVMGCGVT